MRVRFLWAAGFLAAFFLAAHPAAAVTITKSPDLGTVWNPLSPSGTFIYAGSFVAPSSDPVTSLGLWLFPANGAGGTQTITFEIFGTAAGGGPDSSDILATTGPITLTVTPGLNLYTADVTLSLPLTAGETYWFAADERGATGTAGEFSVGGHTQNSGGIVDNGTFWFSNDPTGATFDGRNLTPEIAFTVTLSPTTDVPEPATLALLGTALLGLGWTRGRRRA